jgi:hypothetical protein
MNSDAVQRIAAAVTPAVMVSACGLIALGLDNQAARMSTRLRDLAREYRSLEIHGPRGQVVRRETRTLARRHGLYVAALLCDYAALLCFVLTSASALLSNSAASQAVAVVLFAGGVGLLAAMAVCTILSLRLSRRAIVLEAQEVLSHVSVPPAPQR